VINVEYLAIMHKKAMEKVDVEENRVKKSTTYFIVNEQTLQCATTRSARVDFEYN
jgi:hypothetical protein